MERRYRLMTKLDVRNIASYNRKVADAEAAGEPIPSYPDYTQKLDYEAELALIIGTGGRDIAPERAWDHVFGYTAINDISARDLQKNHLQWFRAKSLDGFAPMGPLVVGVHLDKPLGKADGASWVTCPFLFCR